MSNTTFTITANTIKKGNKYGVFQYYLTGVDAKGNKIGYWKAGQRRIRSDNRIKSSDGSYYHLGTDGNTTTLYKDGLFHESLSPSERKAMLKGMVWDGKWREDDKDALTRLELENAKKSNTFGSNFYKHAQLAEESKDNAVKQIQAIDKAETELMNAKIDSWLLSKRPLVTLDDIVKTDKAKEKVNLAQQKANESYSSYVKNGVFDKEALIKDIETVQTAKSLKSLPDDIKEETSQAIDNLYYAHPTLRKVVNLGLYAAAPFTSGATLPWATAMSTAEAAMAANNMARSGINFNNTMDLLGPVGRMFSTSKAVMPLLNSNIRFAPQLTRGTLSAVEALDKSRIGAQIGRAAAEKLGLDETWQERAEIAGSLVGFGTGRIAGGVAPAIKPTATQYVSLLFAPAVKTLPSNYFTSTVIFPQIDEWSGDNYVKKVLGYTGAGLFGGAVNLEKGYLRTALTDWTKNETRSAGQLAAADFGLNNVWSPLQGLNMSTLRTSVPELLYGKNSPWYKRALGEVASTVADPIMYLTKTGGESAAGGAVMAAGDVLLPEDVKEQSGWDLWKMLGAQKLGEAVYNKGMLTLKKGSGGTSNIGEVSNKIIEYLINNTPPSTYINDAGQEVIERNGSGFSGAYQQRPAGDTTQDFTNNAELYPYEGYINREHDGTIENNYAAGQIIALPKNATRAELHRALMAAVGGMEGRFGQGTEANHHVINDSAPIDWEAAVPLKNGKEGKLWIKRGADHYVVNPEVAMMGIRGDSGFGIGEPNHAVYEFLEKYKDQIDNMSLEALNRELQANELERQNLYTSKMDIAHDLVELKNMIKNFKELSLIKTPEALKEALDLLRVIDIFNKEHPDLQQSWNSINKRLAALDLFAHSPKKLANWRLYYVKNTLLPNPNTPTWNNAGHNGIVYRNLDGSYNVLEWDVPGYKGTSARYNGSVGNTNLVAYAKSLLGQMIEGGGRMISSSASHNLFAPIKYVRTANGLLKPVTVYDELMLATSLKKVPAQMTSPKIEIVGTDINPLHFGLKLFGNTLEQYFLEKAAQQRELIQSPQFNDQIDFNNYKNRVNTLNQLATIGVDVSDRTPVLTFNPPTVNVSEQNKAAYETLASNKKTDRAMLKLQAKINKDLDIVLSLRSKGKLKKRLQNKLNNVLARISANRHQINELRYTANSDLIKRTLLQMEADKLYKAWE